MRVDPESPSTRTDTRRVAPRTFVAALRSRLRPPSPGAGRRAPSVTATRTVTVVSVATQLRAARAEMDATVRGRLESGAGALAASEARSGRRAEDAERTASAHPSAREANASERSGLALQHAEAPWPERADRAPAPIARETAADRAMPLGPGAAPPSQIEAALALVERVETFLRSGRSGLAFQLGGPVRRSVELQRTGPRHVAVSLRGGALEAGDARRLTSELGARGITLVRLEVNGRPAGNR